MATEYKYDVFISYSRKDYVNEATKEIIPDNALSFIMNAFDDNSISYWFDKEGVYSGQEFVEVITDAIASSKIFVFVSSKHSNRSKYTKSEVFAAFRREKRIIPFKIDGTDYDTKLQFYLDPLDFISYLDNKEIAVAELIRSIQIIKEEIAEEEKQKEAEAERIKIKERIKELIEDYQRLSTQQETIQSEIYEQTKLLGLETKSCPVCGKSSKIENLYCDRCGWIFHPLFAVEETYSIPNNKILFSIFKTQWKSLGRITEDRKKLDVLALENEKLKEQLKEIDGAKMEIKALIDENNDLQKTLHDISIECERYIKTIQDKADEADKYSKKAQMLSSENEQLQKEVKTTKDNLVLLTSQNEQLKQNLFIVSKECNETRKEKESEAKFFKEKNTELAKSENYYKKTANLLETQKQELEQKIASLEKELSERKKLCEQSEQKRNQLQKMVKGLEGKSTSTEPLTLYDVFLLSINSNYKLEVVKLIHDLTNIGLKESNDLVDGCPSKILSSIYKEKALEIRGLFKAVDAKVVLRQSVVEDGDDSHSTQNDHKKITSSKEAQELILQCRIDPYRKILANNQIIQTINVEQLKKELEHYGVYMSIYEIKSFKTIEKLKKAIIKKSSISITQQ